MPLRGLWPKSLRLCRRIRDFPVPAQNGIGSHDRGHLLEHLPSEDFAFHSQAPPLIIVEQNAFPAEFLSEHAIFGSKVLDDFLLSMVDPAREDQKQQLPGLQKGFHISPNVR
jgi:hypothetical protein